MAKLMKEQIMVGEQMVERGVSTRQVARQLGVAEGALRYRFRKRAEGREGEDGRRGQPTAVDGYEAAVDAVLERLECWRVTGEGRPAQASTVFEVLGRDYGYGGSYRGVVRHLNLRFGVPPVRAYRRVETPPGVQAQHVWFVARTRIRDPWRVPEERDVPVFVVRGPYEPIAAVWPRFEGQN